LIVKRTKVRIAIAVYKMKGKYNMIQLYYGGGKGKTTAAIGGAIRAAGAGRKVFFVQFMKGNSTSELAVLQQIENIEISRNDRSFGFFEQMREEDKEILTGIHNELLEKAIAFASEKKACALPCCIVLDEITYAYNFNLLGKERLLEFLKEADDMVEIIITGRNPADVILRQADYLSEIVCRRHPFERGVGAREGIEY